MKKLVLAFCVIASCAVAAAQTPPYLRKAFALVDPLTYGAVCKGSDANATADTTGLINAVAYVNTQPANSVTLRIPGECVIDATVSLQPLTITANNVTVTGPGKLRIKTPTLPLNQFYNVTSGTTRHFDFLIVSGNSVTIQNVTFDSNGQAVTNCGGTYGCLWFDAIYGNPAPDKLRVVNNNFPALGGWPVLTSGTNTLIQGNIASESAGMVCSNGASGCQIIGNTTRSAIDAPYAVNGGSTTPLLVTHFLIANNVAIGSSAITPNGNGIDVTAATDGQVSGNYVSGMANGCIQVGKTGGFYTQGAAGTFLSSQRVNVVGNTCKGNNTYGGWPTNGEIIVGDYYSTHGGTSWVAGQTALNIAVKGNFITAYNASSTDLGVFVGYGAQNVTAEENSFAGCGTGVSGACGVTPYRIYDTSLTANLTYVNNHQDSTYAGVIRTQGVGPYEIWGNGNMALSIASGSPTIGPLSYYGDLVSSGNVVIPNQVTGFHGVNGTKVQLSDNSGTSGNLAKYDANGVATDAGIAATAPAKVNNCGTTTTCANTAQASPRVVTGTAALSAGAATVTGMTPFTSTSSFVCSGVDQTSAAAVKIVNASTSSITITGTSTDTIAYTCTGN